MLPPDLDRALERHVHRALMALPMPRAPRTLLPRVLAHLRRPWYARAWLTWPLGLRAASAIAMGLPVFWLAAPNAGVAGPALPEDVDALATLARIVWRQVLDDAVVPLFSVVVAGTLVCAASWAALTRVAFGGRSS